MSEWIKCSDKMPAPWKRVLACTDKGEQIVACRISSGVWNFSIDPIHPCYFAGANIVAWQELPEHYNPINEIDQLKERIQDLEKRLNDKDRKERDLRLTIFQLENQKLSLEKELRTLRVPVDVTPYYCPPVSPPWWKI